MKRFTVEVFKSEDDGGNREAYTNSKAEALRWAEDFHADGSAVIVHDLKTGEKIYDEM